MTENTVERKLRAILCADVKGYSRMMGEDEVGTYQTLTSYLESVRSIISEHNGRVFSSPGDDAGMAFLQPICLLMARMKLSFWMIRRICWMQIAISALRLRSRHQKALNT